MKPSEYAKAIAGALLAGLTALGTALAEDGINAAEWVGVAIAAIGTFAAVFGVPNAPAVGGRRKLGGTGEAGQWSVERALVVAIFVVLLLVVLGWAFDRL